MNVSHLLPTSELQPQAQCLVDFIAWREPSILKRLFHINTISEGKWSHTDFSTLRSSCSEQCCSSLKSPHHFNHVFRGFGGWDVEGRRDKGDNSCKHCCERLHLVWARLGVGFYLVLYCCLFCFGPSCSTHRRKAMVYDLFSPVWRVSRTELYHRNIIPITRVHVRAVSELDQTYGTIVFNQDLCVCFSLVCGQHFISRRYRFCRILSLQVSSLLTSGSHHSNTGCLFFLLL